PTPTPETYTLSLHDALPIWFRDPAVSPHHRNVQAARADLQQADGLLPALYVDARRHPRDSPHHNAAGSGGVPPAAGQRQAPRHPDRKSTRLNSSHDQISYAV